MQKQRGRTNFTGNIEVIEAPKSPDFHFSPGTAQKIQPVI
jgi:hypothetical protein